VRKEEDEEDEEGEEEAEELPSRTCCGIFAKVVRLRL
jgi:hypothetical protein